MPERVRRGGVEVADALAVLAERRGQVGVRRAADVVRDATGSLPVGLTRPDSTPAIAPPPSSPGMNACTAAASRSR